MMYKALRMIAAAMAVCVLTACTAGTVSVPATAALIEKTEPEEAEWAVYWYLCGSNLESGSQSATSDLEEMLSEKLPKDVKVVIQTGGSRSWHIKSVTADGIQRFTAENGKLKKQEKLPLGNMGDAETLADFLSYCLSEHPAKHTMLLMWDHGGGTLGGVSYDMNYNMDSIMLPELKEALSAGLAEKKLDIIGFDACLMSSIDMVEACAGHADYLLSSQQLEPVCGWDYRALAKELDKSGSLTPEALGKAVCDTYYACCEAEELGEIATLSFIDLKTAEGVVWHYNKMIKLMFDEALQSDEMAASIRRAAYASENYGANGRDIGYTDMVDLKGFVSSLEGFADEALLKLIDSSVIYQVRGELSPDGCGISCYYPLDASLRSVIQYTQAAGSHEDTVLFFKYMLSPEYDGAVEAYVGEQNITRAMKEMRYSASDQDLGTVENAVLTMNPEESGRLSDVRVSADIMNCENGKYFWTEQGEIPCTSADYNGGAFDFDGRFKNVMVDDSRFATYIYEQSGTKVKCYSPAVIDGEDAYILFTGDLATGKVVSNGVVTGKAHRKGLYDPTGANLNKGTEEFTDEEIAQYRKEFKKEGTYEEMRNYILSERALMNRNFASPVGKNGRTGENDAENAEVLFMSNRVDSLKKEQEVTPIFRRTVTDSPVKTTGEDGNAGWKEGTPIIIKEDTWFRFEVPDEEIVYTFTVTDAWGNKEITGQFAAEAKYEDSPAEETADETETVTETTEAESAAPEETVPGTTAVPTTAAPTTAASTAATEALPEPTLPAESQAPTYYSGGSDNDDEEPETDMTSNKPSTSAASTTEAPTTEAPTTEAPTTEAPTTEAPTETETETTAPEKTSVSGVEGRL